MRLRKNKTWWLAIIAFFLGMGAFWVWDHFHEDHDHDHHARKVQEEKQKPQQEHGHGHHDDHARKAPEKKEEPLQPGEVRLTPEVIKQTGIETVPVLHGPMDIRVPFTGELVFNEERLAKIRSRVPGRVVQIVADYGQTVKAGDVLAIIDSVELGQARMAARQAAARFNAAQKSYDRARQLYEGKAISRAELQER